MTDSYRPTWAEIDTSAVTANVALLCRLVAPARLCAVVKADGYGHGSVAVARAALAGGAAMLAVALVEEAVTLREAGIDAPVLLLTEAPPDGIGEFLRDRRDADRLQRAGHRPRRRGRGAARTASRRPPEGRHRHAPGRGGLRRRAGARRQRRRVGPAFPGGALDALRGRRRSRRRLHRDADRPVRFRRRQRCGRRVAARRCCTPPIPPARSPIRAAGTTSSAAASPATGTHPPCRSGGCSPGSSGRGRRCARRFR